MEQKPVHSKACLENQKKFLEFEKQYPNHCHRCNGAGYMSYTYDPSPAGVSLGSGYMEETEVCPNCLDKGICPLCGKEGVISNGEDLDYCPHCEYRCTADMEVTSPTAPYHECYCYESEYQWLDDLEIYVPKLGAYYG